MLSNYEYSSGVMRTNPIVIRTNVVVIGTNQVPSTGVSKGEYRY